MLWITSSTLTRLRDQLRENGARPSIAADRKTAPQIAAEALVREYGPLCEAMYLMMSADGETTEDEREVLRGALRNLSDDALGSAQLDAMLAKSAEKVAREGRDARMRSVSAELANDHARAEVAFVLAAAIAFADDAIADRENDTLEELALALGIDEARADALLDSVEKDLEDDRSKRPV